MMISSYPAQMVELVRERWTAGGHDAGQLPDERRLHLLFDVIYQASLLREEGQTIRCRVLLQSPSSFSPCYTCVVEGLQVLPFETPAAYTAHNIRKLAAAAGYQRSLLGVDFDDKGHPWIWGMVVTGAAWLNRIEGSRVMGPELPSALVLHALGPGHIIASAGFRRVLESQSGQLLTEGFDPFRSQWLPRQFEGVRSRVLSQVRGEVSQVAEDALAGCFVREVAQSVVRRALSLVRTRNHGGTLVYVPDDLGPLVDKWFRFRARLSPSPSTRRFGELLRQLTVRAAEIAEANNLTQVRYQDFQQLNDSKFIRLEQALIEFSHLLADYMSVDGCLVMDLDLERISGLDICRALRMSDQWDQLPILLSSPKFEVERRVKAFRSGASDVLTEPMVSEELVARVSCQIDRSRLMRERNERDPLSGLLVRRSFLEAFQRSLAACHRTGNPLSVSLMDLDHFKSINDTYGHSMGDLVIHRFGELLRRRFRVDDLRCRWGGEEFLLAFPSQTAEFAAKASARLLEEFSQIAFVTETGHRFQVTFSAGVAAFPNDGDSLRTLVERADVLLYEGKRAGRNQVVSA